jgi:hypothetical protein
MAITTSMSTSYKSELMQSAHCFNGTITATGNSHTNDTLDSLSSAAGIAVGMGLQSGGDVPSDCVVVNFNSTTSITVYPPLIGSHVGATYTFLGDVYNIALIKSGMAGTYGPGNINYSDITGNSDEVTGSGYSAGGTALGNVTPVTSGTTAYTTFSPNPSWTSATFATAGCMIYNTFMRLAGIAGRCCGVFDFGGTQSVSSGVFTVIMPASGSTTAILRIA